jgi:hypothetical protein
MGAVSGCIRCVWSAITWIMFRIPAMIPNFRPRLGRLNIKGIAVISVIRIIRKKSNHKGETLVCGLVSNPIGGGNSNTVMIKIAIIAPTALHFAGVDAVGLLTEF